MKNTLIAAAIVLATGTAFADSKLEKCKVVKDGKNLIKEHKGDCAGSSHSCAGQNSANDPQAWILVPKGQCKKINAGDLSGIDNTIKNKISNGKK